MRAEKTITIETHQRTIKQQYEQLRKQQTALRQIRRAIYRGYVVRTGPLVEEVIKDY